MAKQRVYGFADEQSFQRVTEATRITLGTPRTGAQRTRRQPVLSSSSKQSILQGFTGLWTTCEYDAISGDILRKFDRGTPRLNTPAIGDVHAIVSSDGFLYAAGTADINRDSGVVVKWNPNSLERVWDSSRGGLNATVVFVFTNANAMDGTLLEASDGAIWCCPGPGSSGNVYVSRTDPDSGVQTHAFGGFGNLGHKLMRADNAGGVVVANPAAASTKYLRVLDATATETAGDTNSIIDVYEHGGLLVTVNATTLRLLDASNLTQLDTRSAPGGQSYQSVATDGTTVFATTATTFRAYDIGNLATENWNAARAGGTSRALYPHNGRLYHASSSLIEKVDPANGSQIWSDAHIARRPTSLAIGSDFVVYVNTVFAGSYNILCLNDSDGSVRWGDFAVLQSASFVTPDDRVYVCGPRRDP